MLPLAPPQRYGTIVVVGGGCYGSYYVRQLGRAARAGALTAERVLVVDRDPACRVATERGESDAQNVEIVVEDWTSFFDRYLGDAAARGSASATGAPDAIVPSPLMPHLMYEWLARRARARWPHRTVEMRPLDAPSGIPWQRRGEDGTQYVSFAEWVCPVNCIEPELCPATRGARSWSMPPAIVAATDEARRRGRNLAGPVIFHCQHRAYGVGMFDTSAVVAGDEVVQRAAASGAAEVLVGTVSHCHGALSVLAVGE
ncbi:MAG: hypothetical protein JJD97_08580 [Gemmatimonadaceae bacterium]|nr:hypothetical protein [Gemmatimonadaceae bacterium]